MNTSPGNNKKGIEISRWKVGESDEFESLEEYKNYDIDFAQPEYDEADVNDEEVASIRGGKWEITSIRKKP